MEVVVSLSSEFASYLAEMNMSRAQVQNVASHVLFLCKDSVEENMFFMGDRGITMRLQSFENFLNDRVRKWNVPKDAPAFRFTAVHKVQKGDDALIVYGYLSTRKEPELAQRFHRLPAHPSSYH